MKITAVEIYRFSIPMIPFTIATGTMDFAQNVFIRVHTNSGLYGVGECSAFPMIVGETQDTCLVMAQEFAKLWLNKDPLDLAGRMEELHLFAAYNFTVKSAFDMALYDIDSKEAGMPLYRFLSGRPRPVETDITIGIDEPVLMAEKAASFVQAGATIVKIKLGKDPAEDIKRVEMIRSAVGTDITLRIDANQGWDLEEAQDILEQLATFKIEFCEQPLPASIDYLLPELVHSSPIPVMADESCYTQHDADRLIRQRGCDAINIKLAKSGGIMEALKIYEVATAAKIPCMIGGMLESRIGLSAKIHFAYACPEIRYFDLDTCLLGHLEDPCQAGVRFDKFRLSIGDQPGIGADADQRFLDKCEKILIS